MGHVGHVGNSPKMDHGFKRGTGLIGQASPISVRWAGTYVVD